jgi:agmatinase
MDFKHFRSPYVFAGIEYMYKESDAILVQVPYDSTTSYRGGTRDGPHAFITASRQLDMYDWELGVEIATKIKVHTLNELEPSMDSPAETISLVKECVSEIVRDEKLPIMVGGEHSLTPGAVAAVKEKYADVSVLQIDAHSDLRDEYEGSKNNHACAMRRTREIVNTVVQVGIRSSCVDEIEYVKKNKLEKFIFGTEFKDEDVLKQLGNSNNVYITVDLDGFDPSEIPGVGTPEPGGLHWPQVIRLLRKVAEKKRIVGFDVMELAPIAGSNQSEFYAAKLAYKLLGYSFLLKR